MNIVIGILVFGLLIFTHELGHFIMARRTGIGVTEFAVGFGPKLISWVRGETRYSLRLIPFGGFCMMVGEDGTDEEAAARPDSFQARPAWARILVLVGGVAFNFMAALILSAVVIGVGGVNKPVVYSVPEGSSAWEAGIRKGDAVTSINGSGISIGGDIELYLLAHPLDGSPVEVGYQRDGAPFTAVIDPNVESWRIGITYTTEDAGAVIREVAQNSPAEEAGLKEGDVVLAANGTELTEDYGLSAYFAEHEMDGSTLSLTVQRGEEKLDLELTPVPYHSLSLGFSASGYYEKAGVGDIFRYSFTEVGYWVRYVFLSLKMLVTGQFRLQDMSGPVGIVSLIGETVKQSAAEGAKYVFLNVATITILLSANLGVFNLLPLPALDGGQLLLQIIEVIRRKKLPEKAKSILNGAGLAFWMGLMAVILVNDVIKLVR